MSTEWKSIAIHSWLPCSSCCFFHDPKCCCSILFVPTIKLIHFSKPGVHPFDRSNRKHHAASTRFIQGASEPQWFLWSARRYDSCQSLCGRTIWYVRVLLSKCIPFQYILIIIQYWNLTLSSKQLTAIFNDDSIHYNIIHYNTIQYK